VPQRRLSPRNRFLTGRKCVETSDDVIKNNFLSPPESRILDFSPMPLGSRKDGKGMGKIAG